MLPVDFLRDAGIAVMPGLIPAREARAWLAGSARRARRAAGQAAAGREAARARLLNNVAWLHLFLARLARQDFPAPHPPPAFTGESWAVKAGELWELVRFIPGREVGWDGEPHLDQIGALLARYHAAPVASRWVLSGLA